LPAFTNNQSLKQKFGYFANNFYTTAAAAAEPILGLAFDSSPKIAAKSTKFYFAAIAAIAAKSGV
jgi:hypothetical protein